MNFRLKNEDCRFAVAALFLLAGCSTPMKVAKPIDPEIGVISVAANKAFARGQVEAAARQFARALDHARAADAAADISDQAYNLAACFLLQDQPAPARRLLAEARTEAVRVNRDTTDVLLLDAKAARQLGQPAEATALADQVAVSSGQPAAKLQALIIKAHVRNDAGQLQPADLSAIRLLGHDVNDAALNAEVENLAGSAAQREHSFGDAAAAFDLEAAGWQRSGHFREMARALARAGAAWQADGRSSEAADRLFRAARSLFAQGDAVGALRQIEPALTAAKAANQDELAARIVALFEEIKQNVAHGAGTAQ